jgi:hypothetical protein
MNLGRNYKLHPKSHDFNLLIRLIYTTRDDRPFKRIDFPL